MRVSGHALQHDLDVGRHAGLELGGRLGDEQADVVGHDAPAVAGGVLAAARDGRDAGDLRVELDAG